MSIVLLRRGLLGLKVTKDDVVELNMTGELSIISVGKGAGLIEASSCFNASASRCVRLSCLEASSCARR